jgi:hypothetical protein
MIYPEYLYHYTSIEALAMILSSRKIKFNSLNQVDDLNEGKCSDITTIGKYFFASSWTDLEEESLPFWNMYTPNMKGVRIKMPSGLFTIYQISFTEINFFLNTPQIDYNSLVSQDDSFHANYWVVPVRDNNLVKVEYTNDLEKLCPKIRAQIDDGNIIDTYKIGIFKAKHWEFQSEWRFLMKILPLNEIEWVSQNSYVSKLLDSLYSIETGVNIPFSEFLVNINEEKFKKMEILLGPKSSESDGIIVNSLINKFNPDAKLLISRLHDTIR